MSIEDAIIRLRILSFIKIENHAEEYEEALQMGIKALSIIDALNMENVLVTPSK